MTLNSEKAAEIINNQRPIDREIFGRVKKALERKGVILHQSEEFDQYLVNSGKEAIVFNEDTVVMHSKVSASGFFEELIHLGQIKSGRADFSSKENNILMEIEAQEKLIRNQNAYKISDYEINIIKNNLKHYESKLKEIKEGGC